MQRIHRKLLITLFIFLDPVPIPTPVLSEDEFSKAVQSTQAFANALSSFTPLMILALALLCVLAAILIFGRKKSDIQPLINSQQKLLDALITRDNDREDKHQEAIEALAITNQEVKAIVTTLNTRDMQSSALIERMVTNAERQTSVLEVMGTKGSEPVQMISKRSEDILKNTVDILTAANSIEVKLAGIEQINIVLIEVKSAISGLQGVVETLNKKKTQPIPIVHPDEATGKASAA